jgi:hypothetical protein
MSANVTVSLVRPYRTSGMHLYQLFPSHLITLQCISCFVVVGKGGGIL